MQTKKKVLIAYSNPADTNRIRLDKEHKAIEQVIKKLKLDSQTVQRLHATTITDIVEELRNSSYEIVQFSGHGSEDGFFIEDEEADQGKYLTPQKVVDILADTASEVKAAIFLSCFSSETLPTLIKAAPYIITVTGETIDDSAITFIKTFYEEYFTSNSIEQAFKVALMFSNVRDQNISTILSRRAKELAKEEEKLLIQVFPAQGFDSLLIDLTQAEQDIKRTGVSRDIFLSILNRKIRMHAWIFEVPRQNALLQFGEFFGVFSWVNSKDVLTCHRIMKVKADVDEKIISLWGKMVLIYNEFHLLKYRAEAQLGSIVRDQWITNAMRSYRMTYQSVLEDKGNAILLNSTVPNQYKVTKATISANLEMCDQKFFDEDNASTVVYLESILSAWHDLIDALSPIIVE